MVKTMADVVRNHGVLSPLSSLGVMMGGMKSFGASRNRLRVLIGGSLGKRETAASGEKFQTRLVFMHIQSFMPRRHARQWLSRIINSGISPVQENSIADPACQTEKCDSDTARKKNINEH